MKEEVLWTARRIGDIAQPEWLAWQKLSKLLHSIFGKELSGHVDFQAK